MRAARAFGKARSRSLVRREQAGEDVKQDHHWSGEQYQCNEAQPDNSRVNPGVIGKTGGDAHQFRIAAVYEETSVHRDFLVQNQSVQAIGNDVAAEMSSIAERSAPTRTAVVSRMEALVNMVIPLVICLVNPTNGSMSDTMHEACQTKKTIYFSDAMNVSQSHAGFYAAYW